MNNPKCQVCGSKMKGNGTTKAGTRRWRCPKCGASSVRKINGSAKTLRTFLRWLFSERRDSRPCDEQSYVLAEDLLGMEALAYSAFYRGDTHDVVFLGRHLVAQEGGRAHSDRRRIRNRMAPRPSRVGLGMGGTGISDPPPKMVVTDGSPGFSKAAKPFGRQPASSAARSTWPAR